MQIRNRVLWSSPGNWLGSSIGFSIRMMIAAAFSLIALCFVMALVARLDIAFFESNGMSASAEIREAFYYQVFQLDGTLVAILAAGFVAVGATSFLFSLSQFNYFYRLADGFKTFGDGMGPPNTDKMGRFGPFATKFFSVLQMRMEGRSLEDLHGRIEEAGHGWPNGPSVSWRDLLQFSVMSCVLGLFFSASSVMIYFKVSGRVVELSGQIMHYPTATAPMFLSAQFEIIDLVVGALLMLTMLVFITIGYRLALRIGQAEYAVLRDLKGIMDGNLKQRIFLRRGDPGQELVPGINTVLDKVAAKIEQPRG